MAIQKQEPIVHCPVSLPNRLFQKQQQHVPTSAYLPACWNGFLSAAPFHKIPLMKNQSSTVVPVKVLDIILFACWGVPSYSLPMIPVWLPIKASFSFHGRKNGSRQWCHPMTKSPRDYNQGINHPLCAAIYHHKFESSSKLILAIITKYCDKTIPGSSIVKRRRSKRKKNIDRIPFCLHTPCFLLFLKKSNNS